MKDLALAFSFAVFGAFLGYTKGYGDCAAGEILPKATNAITQFSTTVKTVDTLADKANKLLDKLRLQKGLVGEEGENQEQGQLETK